MTDAAKPITACQARLEGYGGGMVCDRCALAWDAGDAAPACQPLTFRRMRDAAEAAAHEIEAAQAVTVGAGLRQHRHQPSLQRAQELRGLVRLVERCINSPAVMRELAKRPEVPSARPDEPPQQQEHDDPRDDDGTGGDE